MTSSSSRVDAKVAQGDHSVPLNSKLELSMQKRDKNVSLSWSTLINFFTFSSQEVHYTNTKAIFFFHLNIYSLTIFSIRSNLTHLSNHFKNTLLMSAHTRINIASLKTLGKKSQLSHLERLIR